MKSFDIVKWKERFDQVERNRKEVFASYRKSIKEYLEWRDHIKRSKRGLREEYNLGKERYGWSSFNNYIEYLNGVGKNLKKDQLRKSIIHRLLWNERKKLLELFDKKTENISYNKSDEKTDKKYLYETVPQLVDEYLAKNKKATKENAFYDIAEVMNKSYEAVKRSYYFKPKKLQKRLHNEDVT